MGCLHGCSASYAALYLSCVSCDSSRAEGNHQPAECLTLHLRPLGGMCCNRLMTAFRAAALLALLHCVWVGRPPSGGGQGTQLAGDCLLRGCSAICAALCLGWACCDKLTWKLAGWLPFAAFCCLRHGYISCCLLAVPARCLCLTAAGMLPGLKQQALG